MSREQAFFIANESSLDLVVVSNRTSPPVVRLKDVGKERYELEKRARKHKAHQRSGGVKEIQLSFRIDDHDFQTKLRHAERFLAKGDRIKLFMRLIGRENAFAEQAKDKIRQFASQLGRTIDTLDKQGSRITSMLK
jgi:translation initiation factor IF-3